MSLRQTLVLATAALVTGCGDATFSAKGDAAKPDDNAALANASSADAPADATPSAEPTQDTRVFPRVIGTFSSGGQGSGSAGSGGSGGGGNGSGGSGGSGGGGSSGSSSTTSGDTDFGAVTRQISFGSAHVFHVGDGQYDQTGCKQVIDQYPLTGAGFTFSFTVLTDGTTVDASIGHFCGINDKYADVAELDGPTGPIEQIHLGIPLNDGAALSFKPATLPRGTYSVLVLSGLGPFNDYDYDDFIVGNITIRASAPIRASGVAH